MHDDDLPPEVDAIVMKALAKRVEDRYQSAAAMRSDIDRFLAGHPVAAPPVLLPEPGDIPPPPTPTSTASRLPPVPPAEDDEERRTSLGLLVFLGLLLAALIAAGVIFLPQLFESPPDTVQVPNLIGQTEERARVLLGEAGLQPEQRFGRSATVPAGRVYDQDPGRDQAVEPGSTVVMFISMGRPEVAVPDLVGDARADAERALADGGLEGQFIEVESDQPAGEVVATRPAAGQRVERGSVVEVDYSDGLEAIPDVVGQPRESAEQELRDAGFEPLVAEDTTSEEPAGTVTRQAPDAGEERPQGTLVTIFVSTFEPSPTETVTETPSPTESPTSSPTESPSPSPSPTATGTTRPPDPSLPTDPNAPAGR